MKHNNKIKQSELLDVRQVSDLPPELRAAVQDGPLQETWSLHQKALQLGETVRDAREELSISALGTQGYLNRLEARRTLREQEQKRKAWWRRLSQITWSGVSVAAAAALLWWTPQKVEQDLKITAQLYKKTATQQAVASAKKDNIDQWLQQLGGRVVLDDTEERESNTQHPLTTFVNAENDDIAPISQELPGSLDDLSLLTTEE